MDDAADMTEGQNIIVMDMVRLNGDFVLRFRDYSRNASITLTAMGWTHDETYHWHVDETDLVRLSVFQLTTLIRQIENACGIEITVWSEGAVIGIFQMVQHVSEYEIALCKELIRTGVVKRSDIMVQLRALYRLVSALIPDLVIEVNVKRNSKADKKFVFPRPVR